MLLKGYSPNTIKSYVNMVAAYARHLGKSPESTDYTCCRTGAVPCLT